MDIDTLRNFCLKLKGTTEDFPFDKTTLVFKAAGKIYCIISIAEPYECNLKCNPEKAIELREFYHAVKPGYHMNKKHWNTVMFNKDLSDADLLDLVNHSYQEVIEKLPKKIKNKLFID